MAGCVSSGTSPGTHPANFWANAWEPATPRLNQIPWTPSSSTSVRTVTALVESTVRAAGVPPSAETAYV